MNIYGQMVLWVIAILVIALMIKIGGGLLFGADAGIGEAADGFDFKSFFN